MKINHLDEKSLCCQIHHFDKNDQFGELIALMKIGLSNFYSYTRCSYATNIFTITIKFSIKNLLAKPPSSSQRKKHRRAKKKYPHSCTMRASSYPVLAPGYRSFLLPHYVRTPPACPPPKLYARRASTYASGDRRSRIRQIRAS